MKKKELITIVINSTGSTKINVSHLERVTEYMKHNFDDYELILILNPNESTSNYAELLHNTHCIRILRLAGEAQVEVKYAAGIEAAIGDFVFLLNPDVHSLSAIKDSISKCSEGKEFIIGVDPTHKSVLGKVTKKFLNKLSGNVGYKHFSADNHFRCLSRKAVNALLLTNHHANSLFLKLYRTGLPFTTLQSTTGKGIKKGFGRTLFRAIRLNTYNSSNPLKMVSTLGLFGSLIAVGISLYSLIVNYAVDDVVRGWTTITLFTSVLFCLQFIILSFISEYLSRVLQNSSETGQMFVLEEVNSNVMVDIHRVNVESNNVN